MIQSIKRAILNIITSFVRRKNGALVFYNRPEEVKAFALIKKVKQETEMLLADSEAYQVYLLATKTRKIPGDIAEVGVYRGGSAKLIAEAKGDKQLYLFDTFAGLPELSQNDNSAHFHPNQFPASFTEVKNLLKSYPNVHVYQGLFPQTGEVIKDKKFSFVNLDVDIYESTLKCLEFFYPRMNRGGIILSHDYPKAAGVKKAFDEFFTNKSEIILEAPSRQQCLVIKL
jgi:hypothetical protein